ncbi:MAG: ATP-binding protein [Thermodesulfovibrionales bacterium]|nr:ATP-binding protein [Thermodesulfovibrionales bacterium]
MKNILKDLRHPRDLFSISATDPYKSLKIRVILLDAILSLIPLFIVVTTSYFWFQSILKEDYRSQIKWQIENTKQSLDFFIEERVSGLRFIASAFTYEQLSDRKTLANVFLKFKREVSGLVDIGIIDANGIQQAYVGPYKLEGKDYSNQDWFDEVTVKNVYVSDVFMGYRKLPHFAIAVKRELPEQGTFWILRATIDVETLSKFASAMNLGNKDDAFLINKEGVIQTPSRFHGNVLEKLSFPLPGSQQGATVQEITDSSDACTICGYAELKHSPWVLVAMIQSAPYLKIPRIFKNELFFITIISIIVGIIVVTRIANTLVNRIQEAEKEREDAIAQSEHASKLASVGRLASGVAHEINNPLAIINEKAGLMKDILEASEDQSKSREKFIGLINSIFDSVSRCRTITHRLLGFSRRMDTAHELFDMNDAIREVLGFLEKEILFRNIRLDLVLAEDLPRVMSDRGQVQQVLLNIFNNALDALLEEKEGTITIKTTVNDQKIKVSVSDNGHGIPKDKLKKIFEPFYTTKEKGKGTGLGLFISYGIIKRLGGNILVESEATKGTKFTIEIPTTSTSE